MPAVVIASNMPIEIDGNIYKVTGKVYNGAVNLLCCKTQTLRHATLHELMEDIKNGKASIRPPLGKTETQQKKLRGRLKNQIDALPEKTKAIFERKLAYVTAVWKHMPIARTPQYLTLNSP